MRVAIAGKGGTGKTTLAGTLARELARRGRSVIAIDADTNPNLATMLGVPADGAQDVATIPRNLMERRTDADGTVRSVFAANLEQVLDEYGITAPDGVRLIVMGRVSHSGAGCLCSAHASVRGFLGEIVARDDPRDVVVDMEAGLEHLSRGTGRHLSRFVAVLEPYYRSMETARRVVGLAAELGVKDVMVVATKVRDEGDGRAIREFCATHGMRLVGEIPYDPTLIDAEREGITPIDVRPPGVAVRAISTLADTIFGGTPAVGLANPA